MQEETTSPDPGDPGDLKARRMKDATTSVTPESEARNHTQDLQFGGFKKAGTWL